MANQVIITTDTGSDLRPENLKRFHIDAMIPFYITPEKTTGVIKYLLSSTIRLNIRNEYYIISVKGA